MPRRLPFLPSVEYTTYEFTASSAIDYNYDPSGSTSSEPAFDPYTDVPEPTYHARRPTPSPPTSPSPEYLAESNKPSARLTVPTAARKLLILDLNGTLVYRTPHVQREFRPARRHARAHDHYHSYQPHAPSDPYGDHTAPRPLRVVHARPYIRAFREYLFHPSTRAWLDTMVWSSAQPHSVADMVNKCFGSLQEELFAIWARDTLGLEDRDYNRKVQTTKDLSKPWSELPITPSSPSRSNTPQFHSAHTTLLMDDSPRKAYLQPFNHLCIREYTGALRQIDIQCRQREQRMQQILNSQSHGPSTTSLPPRPPGDTNTNASPSASPTSTSPWLSPSQPFSANKKRKRPKKKHAAAAAAAAGLEPFEHEHEDDDVVLGLGGYDPTLLAVIGVLERIKWEGNVAGWVRSGGLAMSEGERGRGVVEREKGEGGDKGKGKLENDHDHDYDYEHEHEHDNEHANECVTPNHSPTTTAIAPQDPKHQHQRMSNDLSLPVNGTSSTLTALPGTSTMLETIGDTGQWFEDQGVLRYWVRRGVEALERLRIEVVSGIVV